MGRIEIPINSVHYSWLPLPVRFIGHLEKEMSHCLSALRGRGKASYMVCWYMKRSNKGETLRRSTGWASGCPHSDREAEGRQTDNYIGWQIRQDPSRSALGWSKAPLATVSFRTPTSIWTMNPVVSLELDVPRNATWSSAPDAARSQQLGRLWPFLHVCSWPLGSWP